MERRCQELFSVADFRFGTDLGGKRFLTPSSNSAFFQCTLHREAMLLRVQCRRVTKQFGSRTVLDGVDWRVQPGAVTGLVGASGAGKTTLLRVIAGLEPCSAGRVEFFAAERTLPRANVRVGMVFQNLGLWPHLRVRHHLECVLPKLARTARHAQIESLLDEVQLSRQLADRRPSELSGGEAQRLALARALAPEPDLLLLDEPFAQLDGPLRSELLDLVRRVARAREITTICVTHLWLDVVALCERIAVMIDGHIVQEGTAEQLFWQPADADIARLTGAVTGIPYHLIEHHLVCCEPTAADFKETWRDGGDRLLVRPQQIHLTAAGDQHHWHVTRCEAHQTGWLVTLEAGKERLQVPAPGPTPVGENVGVVLKVPPPTAATPRGELE
jgi:iron(III) transport system ATP-binding protein